MNIRRALAGLLCPEMEMESDRLFRLRSDMSEKIRWLGYDYPVVEVVISRMMVDDNNWAMPPSDEDALTLEYPHLGGWWPPEMMQFRDKLRAYFPPSPIITPHPLRQNRKART